MAVVDLNTTEWHNADGLLVKFGAGEAIVTRGGQFGTVAAGQHVVEVSIDLVALTAAANVASGNEVIIADNVTIPNGALIEKIEVTATETVTGASSAIDLGLVDQNRTTEIDFDGLLASALHNTAVGGTIGTVTTYVKGTALAGILVGAVLTNTGLLTASVDVADYTTGVLKVRIFYSVPTATELA